MNNSRNFFLIKSPKFIWVSIILLLFLCQSTNINQAKLIHSTNKYEKKLNYKFGVRNKLKGSGEMQLTIDENKIQGIALGTGVTSQYKVDFHSVIDGNLDIHRGKIKVDVIGEGDPVKVLLPGKISFHGPLEGQVKNKKLLLCGKVKVSGVLARIAGFKKTEKLKIEVTDSSFLKTLREIQKQESLASVFTK